MLRLIALLVCVVYVYGDDVPYSSNQGKCGGHDYEKDGLCCASCHPGFYASRLCGPGSNTVCSPCEDGTFTASTNHAPACVSCRGPCTGHLSESQPCDRTHDRVCNCSTGNYCLLKGQNGCRICAPQTKCPAGYGVSGHTRAGDTLCEKCPPHTYSDSLSPTERCGTSFNYISVGFNLYPVNETSCTTTAGHNEVIKTKEFTVTLNYTDCDPVFHTEYYATSGKEGAGGFFTGTDIYQNTTKVCTLNVEIQCSEGDDIHTLQKTNGGSTMPHSETITVVGSCLSDVNVDIMYSDTNHPGEVDDFVEYHWGTRLRFFPLPKRCTPVS
ncbi:s002R [Rabbit fibroma virus]|uniref:Tumor necrosis factor soluble receptor n=1 Tax=Rabbit fibroma virus (strain Kasza) TaxID=10272 RepID=VT2_RFVKA|nr:gp002L [Rabbit fibroma virus]NP_052049.1 s002R [Rabbit fibroma virus]P25943.1 RecName: Full=Tumor necrosis factor soluble receptor; AltName: Full=Protein T2; Flags: Precursor [Rabbit fibroma virus (strain Kasza)]AAF17884.1 gp002L [Rabbit fibroma virus]AAF18043.1 s002R [Rabbit fibroma virus]